MASADCRWAAISAGGGRRSRRIDCDPAPASRARSAVVHRYALLPLPPSELPGSQRNARPLRRRLGLRFQTFGSHCLNRQATYLLGLRN